MSFKCEDCKKKKGNWATQGLRKRFRRYRDNISHIKGEVRVVKKKDLVRVKKVCMKWALFNKS